MSKPANFDLEQDFPSWRNSDSLPSRKDLAILLMRSWHLLEEALPIALDNVGSIQLTSQEWFWSSFFALDKLLDFTEAGDGLEDDSRSKAYGVDFGEMAEAIEVLISKEQASQ